MQLFEHAKQRASNNVDVHHNVPIFFDGSETPLVNHQFQAGAYKPSTVQEVDVI